MGGTLFIDFLDFIAYTVLMTIIENPAIKTSGFYDTLTPSANTVVRDIVEDVVDLLDVATVKEYFWFHCTAQPNWLEKVQDADIWVHIGLVETASVIADNYEKYGMPSVMHKIVLNDDIRIHPELFEDHNEWPHEVGEARNDPAFSQYHKWDAFRYINSYETPGFISLLVKPEMLMVLETTTLDF